MRRLEHLRGEGGLGRRSFGGEPVGGLHKLPELLAPLPGLGFSLASGAAFPGAAQGELSEPCGAAPPKLHGAGKIALLQSKRGQIADTPERKWMARPEHTLAAFQRPLQKGLRLRIAAPVR